LETIPACAQGQNQGDELAINRPSLIEVKSKLLKGRPMSVIPSCPLVTQAIHDRRNKGWLLETP